MFDLSRKKAFVCDLDGTLLYTLESIKLAINETMRLVGLPGHTLEVYVVPYANDANSSLRTSTSYMISLDLTKSSVTVPVTYDSFDHPEEIPGDLNGDGYVNLKDLLLIKKYVAGKILSEPINVKCADYNGDGVINILDVSAIKKKIAG